MAKKNTEQASGNGGGQNIRSFEKQVKDRIDRGYVCLGLSTPKVAEVPLRSQNDMRSAMAGEGSLYPGGRTAHRTFGMFDSKQSNPIQVDKAGTPGLGYIPWGPSNDLPNKIYNLVANLPYTSAAVNFLVDLTVGHGPKLMYKWARYAGGTVKEELVPYDSAGALIRGRLRELNEQLARRDKAEKEDGGEEGQSSISYASAISWDDAINPKPDGRQNRPEDEPGTLEFEIKKLKDDYREWERTLVEYEVFTQDNNLQLHFLECMTDYWHMDMYCPTVGFTIGRADGWNPTVKYVDRIPDVCVRLEEMDEYLRINHVYYSERWRKDATAKLEDRDIVAYPAVQNKTMLGGWRNIVKQNQRTRVKNRPAWVACPIRRPSANPYYPRASWWSIFSSLVYNYASTLVLDKAIARQNSIMWSKIIFIDQEYLGRMFDLHGAVTPEEQEKIRDDIYSTANDLLQQKENNGKTLLMDKYVGPDGKTVQYSIEIVDVPQPASGAETKDELEEISSIIFFAFGVHPALIGAVPGKSGSTGGTYQRELILIKQNLLEPARSLYLKFLQNIASFNGWDKHAVWKISDMVLTTLDRSKTGTEETVN